MASATVTLPPLGHRVPDLPHAVSVQLPKWQDMIDFAHGVSRVRSVQNGGYPRSFLLQDVQRLHELCIHKFGKPDQECLLYPTKEDALACKSYLVQPPAGADGLDPASIELKCLEFDRNDGASPFTMYAVFLPKADTKTGMIFWRLTGSGISSRQAEFVLQKMLTVKLVDFETHPEAALQPTAEGKKADFTVRQRIADLLERAPIGGPRPTAVSSDDVFLYPTGMSAIYNLTYLLRSWPGAKTVVFGFPYELTLKIQQDYSKECEFYGLGTDTEMDRFEQNLEELAQQGQKIQAVWCECASNPLLRTVDLERLKRLSDKYDFVIVCDETIGSFANVDVLPVVDVLVTSLTKSFSGLADVMAGSVVVNPASRHYSQLRSLVSDNYTNSFYEGDAIKLELNSRPFLPRAAKMNTNAAHLVALLKDFVEDPACPLQRIYHPSTCDWSTKNYEARMRPATPEFAPGYGGLFTLEFDHVGTSEKFFDALDVHKGPSLGAEVTLAQPYVQTVFKYEKPWAASYGLSETIVRISVGLEDTETLKKVFLKALMEITN